MREESPHVTECLHCLVEWKIAFGARFLSKQSQPARNEPSPTSLCPSKPEFQEEKKKKTSNPSTQPWKTQVFATVIRYPEPRSATEHPRSKADKESTATGSTTTIVCTG